MKETFVQIQKKRILARIYKYKNPDRIKDELLAGEVSAYTQYKQKVITPILEDVLRKIEAGEYGICRNCGKEIEKRRLELVPAARECIKCANSA